MNTHRQFQRRNGTKCATWTHPEIARAVQLLEGGLTYESIAIVLYIDGLSPIRRTRHGVRARLKQHEKEGFVTLPVRRRNNPNMFKRKED